MARLDPRPYPYPAQPAEAYKNPRMFEQWKQAEREFWASIDKAEAALGPEDIVGVHLSFSVADGYDEYIVTKARPLTLARIPVGEYYAHPAMIRGLRKDDIMRVKRAHAVFKAPRLQPLIALPPVPPLEEE